jgi:uncharacterized delta-60 repeat protein
VRLNADGSLDNTFNYTTAHNFSSTRIAMQGNRLIVGGSNSRVFRLNENGSEDASFTQQIITSTINEVIVQPDNKILYCSERTVFRLNENGGLDSGFQMTPLTQNGTQRMKLAPDGKIVVVTFSPNIPFRRLLTNGAVDPSFNQYVPTRGSTFAIQADGGILVGDTTALDLGLLNNFVRLNPDGTPDPTFNPGGIGFQEILPGTIRAIEPYPNGKIMLGGKFDVINDVPRRKLARLNADGAVDAGFQINTSGSGNYFSMLNNIYHIHTQKDGKIVVSGWFDYVLNGTTRSNLVRLNTDGSIDPTFVLGVLVKDYSEINDAGRNPFAILGDGKSVVGISRAFINEQVGPVRLLDTGALDNSFIPMVNNQSPLMYIDDLAIQPDGKIIISGSHNPDFSFTRSFKFCRAAQHGRQRGFDLSLQRSAGQAETDALSFAGR